MSSRYKKTFHAEKRWVLSSIVQFREHLGKGGHVIGLKLKQLHSLGRGLEKASYTLDLRGRGGVWNVKKMGTISRKEKTQRTQRPVIRKHIFGMATCLKWLCPKKEQRNQGERSCNDKFHHNGSYGFSQVCWAIRSYTATIVPGLQ